MSCRSIAQLIALAFFVSACANNQHAAIHPPREEKVCAIYTSLLSFASEDSMHALAALGPPLPATEPAATQPAAAVQPATGAVVKKAKKREYASSSTHAASQPYSDLLDDSTPFGILMDKHRRSLAGTKNDSEIAMAHEAGFNTAFITLYPIHGRDWWSLPQARAMVASAAARGVKEHFHVHMGFSLFNSWMCEHPEKYPGASRTIQCDGTRPNWVCYFDDGLWNYYIKNAVELAKVGNEIQGNIDGIFVDPEAYGPECYLCFCDNCVRKFNDWSGQHMPTGLVKPDSWLLARGLWNRYSKDWHDHEVLRHAIDLRKAVHAVNPNLRLSSLLWDYPVAVGVGDPRQQYFRMLAIGLGTTAKPSWVLPEHTYYSDGPDLKRIIDQVYTDIDAAGASGRVEVLPGIRILRRSASSLLERGEVLKQSRVPGYWFYELGDLGEKGIIDFEGAPTDPGPQYIGAFRKMNRELRAPVKSVTP